MDLRDLVDRRRIEDLTFAYAIALDTKDWEALAACFAEDGILRLGVSPRVFCGRDAIRAGMAEITGHLVGNLHPTANHQYVVDGDRATGTCLFVSYQWTGATERPGALHLHAGRYRDDLVRSGDGWLIRDRTIDLQCQRAL